MSGTRIPTPLESKIALLLMFLLLAIAAAILHKQADFSPAVQAPMLAGPSAQQVETRSPDGDLALDVFMIDALRPVSVKQVYLPQTLSDKINGKAELYLSAGFRQLITQRYELKADPSLWLEVFSYDMNNGENGFSVFSMQRREAEAMPDLTRLAYRSGNAIFFSTGRYYWEIIASELDEPLMQASHQLARQIVARMKTTDTVLTELALFPAKGLVAGSEQLVAANAFGFDLFDRVFTARYQLEGHSATLFLSRQASRQQARKTAGAYVDFLLEYGGNPKPAVEPFHLIEILDLYELIFIHDNWILGVHEAPSARIAMDRARSLAQQIEASAIENKPQ